jgi:hypothetical protein
MARIFKVLSVLALFLTGTTALAQEPATIPTTPSSPKPLQLIRFVPTGEERIIGIVTALYPDCSSRGPTVGRVIEKPAHGEVSFVTGDVFPNMPSTSPLSACNSKRVPGLMINYHSESNFIGEE